MPENHQIGGGFTEGELQFASFWVRNQVALGKFGRGALLAVNIGLWSFALWGLMDAYVISYPRESRITADIARNQFLASEMTSNRPKSIDTRSVMVFQATDSRLDFLVPISNTNKDWWAEFTYRFNVSGELTPQRSGFILPGQASYLGEFGFKPATKGARSGVLTVDNIRWHRTDPTIVGADYPGWVGRRNQLTVENKQYISNLEVGEKAVARSTFTLANPSAYGFWSVPIYVVLKRAQTPVAATSITLNRLQPGERRDVRLDWFERLPAITDTEVVPVINFLDPSVYLPTTQSGE